MRLATSWHNAIAHIDADGFYAGCEAVRHPELRGNPICVLSNQNAFVVANCYDAKALGITTGMSVYDAKKLAPSAAYLSPDFRYYGQLSDKMFSILRRYSPDIEVYSIDEGFMDMNGIRTLWRKGFRQLADEMRKTVQREIGITVSIGVSNTRTLAKMASESNKPNGTTVIPGKRIERFLVDIHVSDIPGIGRNRAALLYKFNIYTAGQFASSPESLIKRLFGKAGLTLWYELNGHSVTKLEVDPPTPKSVARTSSLGQVTDDKQIVSAFLTYHTSRLVSELVAKKLHTRRISVFLAMKSFENEGKEVRFDYPTNSFRRLTKAVQKAFMLLYRENVLYRGSGIVATHLTKAESVTGNLFGSMREDVRQEKLMLIVNDINQKYGNQTVAPASIMSIKQKKSHPRFKYPMLEAH